MTEQILSYLEQAGVAISLCAVAVIIGGFALSWGRYAHMLRSGGLTPRENFKRFKIEFGRALTLGLEILVLADVIETITVEPNFQSLAVLAFLVVVRTVMSWSLTLDIEGRWPWQPSTEGQERA